MERHNHRHNRKAHTENSQIGTMHEVCRSILKIYAKTSHLDIKVARLLRPSERIQVREAVH